MTDTRSFTSANGAIFYLPADPYPISRSVRAGDFVITSALGDRMRTNDADPFDADEGAFQREAHGTFKAVRAALALAGASLSDVVDCQVWLRDPADFSALNEVYRTYFTETAPVRQVFQNIFMFNFRIEVKVTAFAPLRLGASSS